MNSSFMKMATGRVITALKDRPSTFEELCRKCHGLYPTTIRDIIDDLKLQSYLIPIYTTKDLSIRFPAEDECYYDAKEIVTATVQNNPVLSSWYFSWNTCSVLAQLDQWKGKRLLFLGAPRLFEFFFSRKYGESLTLIDLDGYVLNSLEERYHLSSYGNYKCYRANIGCFDFNHYQNRITEKYDYVFFDPPWYPQNYYSWLHVAQHLVKQGGTIVFSLFPPLIRPTAVSERRAIMETCRRISGSTYVCSGILEYDIPSFERKELEVEGLYLYSNWKTADMVILNSVDTAAQIALLDLAEEYLGWTEFNWLNMRWFIKQCKGTDTEASLLSTPNGSRFLASPSRRNKQLDNVNLMSSKGHGLHVTDSEHFLRIIKEIKQAEEEQAYYDIISLLDVDINTKELLLLLGDDN